MACDMHLCHMPMLHGTRPLPGPMPSYLHVIVWHATCTCQANRVPYAYAILRILPVLVPYTCAFGTMPLPFPVPCSTTHASIHTSLSHVLHFMHAAKRSAHTAKVFVPCAMSLAIDSMQASSRRKLHSWPTSLFACRTVRLTYADSHPPFLLSRFSSYIDYHPLPPALIVLMCVDELARTLVFDWLAGLSVAWLLQRPRMLTQQRVRVYVLYAYGL